MVQPTGCILILEHSNARAFSDVCPYAMKVDVAAAQFFLSKRSTWAPFDKQPQLVIIKFFPI